MKMNKFKRFLAVFLAAVGFLAAVFLTAVFFLSAIINPHSLSFNF